MAVRTDFVAGEVLAAQDLDDTFASKPTKTFGTAVPSSPVSGDLFFDTADTPPTPKFWDGSAFQNIAAPSGLVHINTTAFSAVSSVSLNSVFTSTHANYRIICHLTSASADTTLNVRLRVSAADNTTTNYAFGGYFQSYGAGLTTEGGTSQTLWQISGARNGANSFASFDMIAPELAQRTMYAASGSDAANGRNYVGTFNATTVFDGFSLFPGTGNITGTVRVYGYKNS